MVTTLEMLFISYDSYNNIYIMATTLTILSMSGLLLYSHTIVTLSYDFLYHAILPQVFVLYIVCRLPDVCLFLSIMLFIRYFCLFMALFVLF